MNASLTPAPRRVPQTPQGVLGLGERLAQQRILEAARRRARTEERGAELVIVAVALCLPFQVDLIGRLYLPEVLLLMLLPALLVQRRRPITGAARWLLALTGLWLASQMATDFLVGTPFTDLARGWARPVFLATNFLALYLLLGTSHRRILLAGGAFAVGRYLDFAITPTEAELLSPWKFGYSLPIAMAAAVVATLLYRRYHWIPAVLLLGGVAAAHLIEGHRSLAGVCFLAALYVAVASTPFSLPLRRVRPSFPTLALVVAAGAVAAWAFLNLYGWAAQSGRLGPEAELLYQQQGAGAWGVLIGGRPSTYISYLAISDSPIVGHGSWAQDEGARYYATALSVLRSVGYEVYLDFDGLIQSHSQVFGAWVEAGILGTPVWLLVIGMALRSLLLALNRRWALLPLVGYLGTLVLWDVLFSPFGGDSRLMLAYALVVLLAVPPSRDAASLRAIGIVRR